MANAPVAFNNYSGSCAGSGSRRCFYRRYFVCLVLSSTGHTRQWGTDATPLKKPAGSGDFHMYRQWRRKEFSRLAQMDRDSKEVHGSSEKPAVAVVCLSEPPPSPSSAHPPLCSPTVDESWSVCACRCVHVRDFNTLPVLQEKREAQFQEQRAATVKAHEDKVQAKQEKRKNKKARAKANKAKHKAEAKAAKAGGEPAVEGEGDQEGEADGHTDEDEGEGERSAKKAKTQEPVSPGSKGE